MRWLEGNVAFFIASCSCSSRWDVSRLHENRLLIFCPIQVLNWIPRTTRSYIGMHRLQLYITMEIIPNTAFVAY